MKITLIIAVIVMLVILAGIGFVLLNKNKNSSGAPDLSNKKKPSVPKKPIAQSFPVASMDAKPKNSALEHIKNAQLYMDQQRYDNAEVELKKGLFLEPNNSEFSLKLLNLYMLTNNRDEFDNLFLKIQDSSDPKITAEALRLMSLMDDVTIKETTASVQQPQTIPASTMDNSLDFNSGNGSELDFPELNTSTAKSSSLDAFSFDEPAATPNNIDGNDGLSFDDMNTSSPAKQDNAFNLDTFDLNEFTDSKSTAVNNDVDSFSLESDSNKNQTAQGNDIFESLSIGTTTKEDTSNKLDFDIEKNTTSGDVSDLSFDMNQSGSDSFTQLTVNNDLNTDFQQNNIDGSVDDGLDFNLQDMSTTTSDDAPVDSIDFNIEQKQTKTASTSLDDSFNFDELDITDTSDKQTSIQDSEFKVNSFDVDQPAQSHTAADRSFDSLNLDLDVENNSLNDEITSQSLENSSKNNFLDSAVKATAGVTAVGMAATAFDGLDDFDLSIDDAVQENTDMVSHAPVTDNLDTNLDDFDFDTDFDMGTNSEISTESPINDTLVDEFDLSDSFNLDEDFGNVNVNEPQSVLNNVVTEDDSIQDTFIQENLASPSLDTGHVNQNFDFVNGLDSNEITLNLATQYFELGEYDSAKRLLNEVLTLGDQSQVEQANSLLAQVG